MRIFFLLLYCLLGFNLFAQSSWFAIERVDNDYVTYKDTESPRVEAPKDVIKNMSAILKSSQLPFSEKEISLYKIDIDSNIQAFVLVSHFPTYQYAYIFLYNTKEKTTSNAPVGINLKWAANNEQGFDFKMLKYPLVEIKKEDSSYKVYLKERVHNGNMYDAVITKIYNINNALSFQLAYCYESYAVLDENTYIERLLKDNVITVFKSTVNSKEYLGSIILSDNNTKINSIVCNNENYCNILFTNSEKSNDEILKNGYFFY